MKRLHTVLLLAVAAGSFGLSARAQDEQLVLTPPLSQVFPLQAGPAGVQVACPVLLNTQSILKPGSLLRFIYIDPSAPFKERAAGDGPGAGFQSSAGAHGTLTQDPDNGGMRHGEADPAGGWSKPMGNDVDGIFDGSDSKKETKTRRQELASEVWHQPDLFREALDHATEVGTTFVYNRPAEKRNSTTSIDLPEGMLLAEMNGHVRVLALKEDASAYRAGIRAGDEIRGINGGGPILTLEDFVREYEATKHLMKTTGGSSYAIGIFSGSTGQLTSVQISAPPSIPSFF